MAKKKRVVVRKPKGKLRPMPTRSQVLRIGTDDKGNPIFLNQAQASKAARKRKK